MSEVVENVSEQQNSAPSLEASQSTEADCKEITNNVEEAVPAAIEIAPTATTETGDESLQKPVTEESTSTSPKVDNKKTPVKRTRLSFIERAQKESEELVRTLGGSLEMEGGRRTRSSTRGTPTRTAAVSTPPPTKKSRASPASGTSTPTRGRGRKLDTTADGSAEDETSPTTGKKKTPAKGRKSAAKKILEEHHQDDEKQKDVKETENKAVDNAPDSKPANEDVVEAGATADVVVSEETKTAEIKETVNEVDAEVVKAQDTTDAVLEPVVEETQSQIAVAATVEAIPAEENITKEPENDSHNEKVILAETKGNDSPMETEESIIPPKESEETEEQNAEIITAQIEATKEPTPEPMEVDSSSKSNEAFEKVEQDAVAAEVVEQPKTLVPEVQQETLTTNISNLNAVNIVNENVEQNTLLVDGVAALSSNIVDNNTTDAKLVNEIPAEAVATESAFGNLNEKSTEETTPAANNDLNKSENHLCEPKIATSPPISAANDNGGVTTPQTCN